MKESGLETEETDMECKFGLMELVMRVLESFINLNTFVLTDC